MPKQEEQQQPQEEIINKINIDEDVINNFYYLSTDKIKYGMSRIFKIPMSTLEAALNEDCLTYHIISEQPIHLNGSELLYLVHYLDQPKYFKFHPTPYKMETSKQVPLFIPIFLYQKQLWISSQFDSLEHFKSTFKLFTSEEEYNQNLLFTFEKKSSITDNNNKEEVEEELVVAKSPILFI